MNPLVDSYTISVYNIVAYIRFDVNPNNALQVVERTVLSFMYARLMLSSLVIRGQRFPCRFIALSNKKRDVRFRFRFRY